MLRNKAEKFGNTVIRDSNREIYKMLMFIQTYFTGAKLKCLYRYFSSVEKN